MARLHIPAELRRQVIERAGDCCEYCLMHQSDIMLAHHIDHVRPLKHRGQTSLLNLALSCVVCNLYKGTDFATFGATDDEVVLLFNPRKHSWWEHFKLEGAEIVGLTPIGIATVTILQFNLPNRVMQRQALMESDAYPPAQCE